MITFLDGPAIGKALMLRNCPQMLRVTRDKQTGQFDALDAPGDEPRPTEEVFQYQLVERTGGAFVDFGGKKKGASGFYPIAKYKLSQ